MDVDKEGPVTVRFDSDVEFEVPWEVAGFRLSECLNEPFELVVELWTTDLWGEPAKLLGASATLTVERLSMHREISGIVERVEDGAVEDGRLLTRLTIVPALVALGLRKTSRIFQSKTIPEILEEVLNEGLGPFDRKVDLGFVSGSYTSQEYTVQYQETDLHFVSRLCEEYGISYRFTCEGGVETLTLGDSDSAWQDLESLGNATGMLPVMLRDGGAGMREDVRVFQRTSKLRSTVARTMVFDWMSPASLTQVENAEAASLDSPNGAELGPEREEYDHGEPSTLYGYRTDGLVASDVDKQVALRRALHQRDAIRCAGVSGATQLTPGQKFELFNHPQADLDQQYLVTEVVHSFGSFAGANDSGTDSYTNRFECIPLAVEWRPARQHPRPRISSVQTATVVGPSGEEIHTDEHGRIKVQFHWDRGGAADENSSCFVRVVQPWSGNGWGHVFLPRIGMEVVVTFVEGDPDRPIITGCLYNGQNRPPYTLPDDKTKSTIKTSSSPGGSGFNELRFEDASGSEEIYIHAQKDFNEVVLNDHNTTVGNNQTNNVDVDQTQTIHGNQTETIDGNQEMTVNGTRTVHVVGAFDETLDATETRNVTGDVTETFSANETRTISGNQSETISGSVTRTISGSQTDTITGSLTETITGGITTTTPGNLAVTAAGGITMTTTGSMVVTAVGGFTVLAPGGTKTVDNDFWSFGGGQGAAFGYQIALTGMKQDFSGFVTEMNLVKMEATVMAECQNAICVENRALEVSNTATAVHVAAGRIYNAVMNIFT